MSDPANKIRELLNLTDFPFQHYCAEQISRLDQYELSVEVPFTHPSTNGPLLGAYGSIDILAARPDASGRALMCFAIECKKANDDIKNWVLVPNRQQYPRWPTFVFSEVEAGKEERLGVDRAVRFPALGYRTGDDFNYCINGLEANNALMAANQGKGERYITHSGGPCMAASPLK